MTEIGWGTIATPSVRAGTAWPFQSVPAHHGAVANSRYPHPLNPTVPIGWLRTPADQGLLLSALSQSLAWPLSASTRTSPIGPRRLDPILDPISLKPADAAQDRMARRRAGKPTNLHGLGHDICEGTNLCDLQNRGCDPPLGASDTDREYIRSSQLIVVATRRPRRE